MKTDHKNIIQYNKPNIPLRRKIALLYSRILLALKVIVFVVLILLFYTHSLDFIKEDFSHNIHDIAGDMGLKLENVFIEGQKNISSDKILEILDADRGTAILSIDLGKIREKLEQNPWVKSAIIERKLPSTIYITIFERTPIARWQVNKQLFLIDDEGSKITSNKLENFSTLLHVVGTDANVYASQLIKDLEQYPEIANKIVSAVRYGERRWNLNLQQNITIKMPEINFSAAIQYIADLNKKNKLFDQKYKIIDLRDHNKYYLEKFSD